MAVSVSPVSTCPWRSWPWWRPRRYEGYITRRQRPTSWGVERCCRRPRVCPGQADRGRPGSVCYRTGNVYHEVPESVGSRAVLLPCDMQYSLVEGERKEPQPGSRGTCPVCGGNTVAKCGTKLLWHWSHGRHQSCDPWWENETEWHRGWKSHFPAGNREVVQHDVQTGEKHVADVKTDRGVVVEFQNSPMEIGELLSRELFYKDMVWIVNGANFAPQFHVLGKLPRPDTEFSRDLMFVPRKHTQLTSMGLFQRVSEGAGPGKLSEVHAVATIAPEIDLEYRGHHMFEWTRPRSVWFDANSPVFLDFGSDDLLLLGVFNQRGRRFVCRTPKTELVASLGGRFPETF